MSKHHGAAHTVTEHERFLRCILDSLAEMIVIVNEDGVIIASNKAWDDFVPDRPVNAEPTQLPRYPDVCSDTNHLSPEDASHVRIGFQDVLSGARDEFLFEYLCRTPGVDRWYLMRARPFLDRGATCVVISHQDITQRRLSEESVRNRLEELARATRQTETVNRELDQFAYVTSHDLKAPLRGIASLAKWIEQDFGDSLNDTVREHLRLMKNRVGRMERMIEGLLQYSRVGKIRIRVERVDVRRLVEETIDLLAPPPGFNVRIDSEMPVIQTERVRLQQVLLNLIGNAVKHHNRPDGVVRITSVKYGGFYEFSVADDGPGIDPRFHEKAFTIFQTLQSRDKVEGTGLGLALVRKIVENQGGTVTLQSQAGEGAVFRFTWPAEPRTDSRRSATATATASDSQLRLSGTK